MLETMIVHDQHNQVHAFDADLQSPTSTANRIQTRARSSHRTCGRTLFPGRVCRQ